MQNDDELVGQLLTRREAVRLMGLSGAAALIPWDRPAWAQTGAATGCVVRPELTEGPFFLDAAIARIDIRTNTSSGIMRDGRVLTLAFNVSQVAAGRCSPLPGAIVHVWQCDAVGIYAGVTDPPVESGDTRDNALRGTQKTDHRGAATFTTIYPGWYRGRAVHIHFKIRTQARDQGYEYTSQLFFPEDLTDEVHGQQPYAGHGRRDTRNDRDMIYREAGDQLLLRPAKAGDAYAATMEIVLDLSDASVGGPDAEGMRGRGGRGRGRGGRGRPR